MSDIEDYFDTKNPYEGTSVPNESKQIDKQLVQLLKNSNVVLDEIDFLNTLKTTPVGTGLLPGIPSHSNAFVFITRPDLNLSSPSLVYDRIFQALNTTEKDSYAYMIRCLLDPVYTMRNLTSANQSKLINPHSPFNIPLSNMVTGINGWAPYTVETESTEGGFFSENQTYAVGSDRLYRTYNFQLTFQDLPFSPLMKMFQFWCHYQAGVVTGDLVPYIRNIDYRRLDYTCSIYQFNVTPCGRYITDYAKATGCYPTNVPFDDLFNFNANSGLSTEMSQISIPFVVNNIKYNDPLRIVDFNILMKWFAPGIENTKVVDPTKGVKGYLLPFIVSTPNGFQITWRDYKTAHKSQQKQSEKEILEAIQQQANMLDLFVV